MKSEDRLNDRFMRPCECPYSCAAYAVLSQKHSSAVSVSDGRDSADDRFIVFPVL